MRTDVVHEAYQEVGPGRWAPARNLQGTGSTRRWLQRRCMNNGGHCEHEANPRNPAYCCRCGRASRLIDRVMRR